MKKLIVILILNAALAFAARDAAADGDGRHFVRADWSARSLLLDNVEDREVVVVSLPIVDASRISARIVDESQMIDGCRVIGIREAGDRVEIGLRLGDTNRDDGWNGCTAEISGDDVVRVDFGYDIAD